MAAIYFDTSFLFKLYIVESRSEEAWAILASLRTPGLTSWLSDVEMVTSFYRSQSPEDARRAYADFLSDRAAGLFSYVALDRETYAFAIDLAQQHAARFKLRSLDTLHLATAVTRRASTIATYDDRLAQAARAVGLQVIPA